MNTDYNDDPIRAAFSVLEVEDVSPARAASLRRRCHAVLSLGTAATEPPPQRFGWRHWLPPAAAAAWSAVYVLETIRRALAFYRAS